MVFPIYVSLERLDKRLLEASADLGARPLATFRQVTLPLSIPGVATGCMLVFILLMGEFLIPALLGGGKVFFVGNALVDLFLQSRNWAFGSAVAVTLIAHHAGDRDPLHAPDRPAEHRRRDVSIM
jgi:spermidine/putrescine transport system permease protein